MGMENLLWRIWFSLENDSRSMKYVYRIWYDVVAKAKKAAKDGENVWKMYGFVVMTVNANH